MLPIRIDCIAQTGSTNSDMLTRATKGAQEGEWLRAERQSAGRGRLGRNWLENTGNLYASTIIRIRPDDPPATLLAMVAGIAIADAVLDFAPCGSVQLKWPNDIMAGQAKMGGILLERIDDAVVAGFGLNIVSAPQIEERKTIALADIMPANLPIPNAQHLCEKLAAHFANSITLWRSTASERSVVLNKWCALAHQEGAVLSVKDYQGKAITGRFAGVENDGALRLRNDDDSVTVIRAGDVSLIGDEGN